MSPAEAICPHPAVETNPPYDTPLFQECWWRFLAPKFDILHRQQELLVLRKKMLKGFLTLKEARILGWNSAWNQDLTPERARELNSLQNDCGWNYFKMIWTESRRDKQRFELLEAAGYSVLHRKHTPQYIADLSQGYEGYLSSLSHNGRTNLRKKVRRAQGLNPHLVALTEESEIEPFFEEFFRYHIPYWTEKTGNSYFSDKEERDFIVEWSKALHRTGHIRMDRLMLGGQVANLCVRLIFGKEAYYLLTINTHAHKDFVPGIVGFAMRIEELANMGIQQYNLGAGDFFYKVQSANRIEPCYETVVVNPASLKGRAYKKWLSRQQNDAGKHDDQRHFRKPCG
jgi:hypothetical protein